ncbi:multisite-specific tRNA:(cytosine-C(5))-methyltransferase [Ranunculus cassubicifolius]
MGGKRGRTQRKHFRENRENVWKKTKSETNNTNPDNNNSSSHTPWDEFATQNIEFEKYYKAQGIVSVDEWDKFLAMLHKPLPAAFRINSSGQFYQDIRSQLENDFMKTLELEVDNSSDEVNAIRPLPWYPHNLAWHSNYSRMQLRKNQTLAKFHEFLKQANEIGNITRQEAVSMVPPLFLDVRPDYFIIDMCAAPGSKTFQLLEMIHQSSESGLLPAGMVVANDVDVQRCNLLIHQTKRMCSANLIVTNHEAQHFPGCHNKISTSKPENGEELAINQLLFDRVLCDVPCSGDGTLRKAPDIWRKWNAGMGNAVHRLQVDIAMRGIALLKVGGRMVYSTCSMNPVENEAVVAEVLRRCGGSVELLDVSSELPQLIRRPGLKTWKIRDKELPETDDNPQENVGAADTVSERKSQNEDGINMDTEQLDNLVSTDSVLEPEDEEGEVSSFPLERCMRIVPHDQNTGSFFIAVFHKLSSLPAVEKNNNKNGHTVDIDDKVEEIPQGKIVKLDSVLSEPNVASIEEEDKEGDEFELGENGEKKKSKIQSKWRGVDPVVIFQDEATINGIREFYGISESFPFKNHLVTRNSDVERVKRIYYISKSVGDVLKLNIHVGQRLKITSVGLKIFERQTSKEGTSAGCLYRISSEGLPLLLPHITKQILCASLVDFRHLLQYKSIKFADFVDGKFGEAASNLLLGCCVIVLAEGDQTVDGSVRASASSIAIGCWKGKTNISVMVSGADCEELLARLTVRMGGEKDSSPCDLEKQVKDQDVEVGGD